MSLLSFPFVNLYCVLGVLVVTPLNNTETENTLYILKRPVIYGFIMYYCWLYPTSQRQLLCFWIRCGYNYGWASDHIKFDTVKLKTQVGLWLWAFAIRADIFNHKEGTSNSPEVSGPFYLCSHSRKSYHQISNCSLWGLWKFLVTYLCYLFINTCS
jgi:hypothetical protein